MSEPKEELRESWFAKPVRLSERPSSLPPPPPPARSARATFALGALAGLVGGAAALLLAGQMTRSFGPALDIAEEVGRGVGHGREAGVALAAGAGALLGGLLALAMRHARLWIGRLIFASIGSAALWFCVHVALLARHHATLPLVPMLLGMAAYGACIAAVPPARRARGGLNGSGEAAR